MVDIHSHVVPNVDDGSSSIIQSLDMIRNAMENGVKFIVATPHYFIGKYVVGKDEITDNIEKINILLKEKELDIRLVVGNEIMLDVETLELLKTDKLLSINNSRYVLIEFDMQILYANIYQIIHRIVEYGYIPVIAHPERYRYIQKDVKIAEKLIKAGALLQMDIASINGCYGNSAKDSLKKLLKLKLIHTWGSDYHYCRDNPYHEFKKTLKQVERLINNKKIYDDVIINNGYKIINNEEIGI